MHPDYEFAHLDPEDIERVHAMERDLGRRYHREIVLIAYEKPGGPADQRPLETSPETSENLQTAMGRPQATRRMPWWAHGLREGERRPVQEGLGGPSRGTTFGYTEAQFDAYPTLADLQSKYDGFPDGLHRSVDQESREEDQPGH